MRIKRQIIHNKLDPVWSGQHTVINKPGEFTVELENGSKWNTEKLMIDNNIEQEMPALDAANEDIGSEPGREEIDSQQDEEFHSAEESRSRRVQDQPRAKPEQVPAQEEKPPVQSKWQAEADLGNLAISYADLNVFVMFI